MAKDRKDKGSKDVESKSSQELKVNFSKLNHLVEEFMEDVYENFDSLFEKHLLEGVEDKISKYRFNLHHFDFKGHRLPVVLQNDNGPCPLLAIVNCLFMTHEISLEPNKTEVSQTYLQTLVANLLLKKHEEGFDFDLDSAWSLVLELATGIDINPGFDRINHFAEGSGELIFKAMGVPLFHGLVVDPKDADTIAIASGKYFGDLALELGGYKKELDVLIQGEESARLNIVKEHIEKITHLVGGGLTVTGLIRLREELEELRPSVLYMSQHYRTIIKFKDQIYCLVTDEGAIQHKPWVTWERLKDGKGDIEDCASSFDPVNDKFHMLKLGLKAPAARAQRPYKTTASKDSCIVTTPATGLKNNPKQKKVSPEQVCFIPEQVCDFCFDFVDLSDGKTIDDHICDNELDDHRKLWGHHSGYHHAQGPSKKKRKS